MANSLNIINNFTAVIDGNTYTGKQGDVDDALADQYAITTTGPAHVVPGSLATATVVTVFDDDDDVPADWDYFYLWTEVDMYVQIIASATNVVHKVKAKVPFVLGYDSLLAAANTTAITGGAEPSVTDIDSVVLGNYSGNTGKFLAAFFD